jgi:hypothetical protein
MEIFFVSHLIKKQINFFFNFNLVEFSELIDNFHHCIVLDQIIIQADIQYMIRLDILGKEFTDD